MELTGWTLPGSAAQSGSGDGWSWTNVTNVLTDTTAYAYCDVDTRERSDIIEVTNFNWTNPIPSGSTIDEVEMRFRRKCSSSGDHEDGIVRLIVGGVITGSDLRSGGSWPTTYATVDYGGAVTLWTPSLTSADVNASNFGVAISSEDYGTGSERVSVETIWMQIGFTPPPSGPSLKEVIQYP